MLDKQYDVLGLKVNIKGIPTTAEEFDELAKRQNACLDEAVKNTLYRGTYSDIREELCEKIAEVHGIARKMKPGKVRTDGTPGAEVPDETEADYIARAAARLDEAEGLNADNGKGVARFQPIADELDVTFDPSAKERKAGEGRIAKVYLEAADTILASGKAQNAVDKLVSLNPGLVIDFDPDGVPVKTSLALAVKANEDRKRRESVSELID